MPTRPARGMTSACPINPATDRAHHQTSVPHGQIRSMDCQASEPKVLKRHDFTVKVYHVDTSTTDNGYRPQIACDAWTAASVALVHPRDSSCSES